MTSLAYPSAAGLSNRLIALFGRAKHEILEAAITGGKLSKQPPFQPIVYGLATLVIAAGTYFLGYTVGHQNLVFEEGFRPSVTNKELGKPKDINFALFWEAWNKVENSFAGPIDSQKMIYGAINGALASLEDPYTMFLPPDEAKRFDETLKGSFEGIGAELEKRDNNITVVAPLEDSPAQKAGLKAQDIILKVNDEEVTNLSIDEAVEKIRGNRGTTVKLTVYREGQAQPLEISIVRDTIVLKSVTWEVKDKNIGYIKVNLFGEDTLQLIRQAVSELQSKKVSGLIVDVRNNPGGLLETSVDMSSLFLKDRGAVVKEKDKDGKIQSFNATLPVAEGDLPMMILTNGGSASASEIFAGALQDYGRAKLIGEKTYGKGSVQALEKVSGGGSVRVTIAKWLTPKDRQIDKVGIEPDIKVELTEEDVKAERDPQLTRAIEELTK